jgi:hypothetical protein
LSSVEYEDAVQCNGAWQSTRTGLQAGWDWTKQGKVLKESSRNRGSRTRR